MCGRYTLTTPEEIVQEFGWGELPFSLSPRYNIAPSQEAPVVVQQSGRLTLQLLRWGIENTSGRCSINARAESVHEKPTFCDAFARSRCLVCADGFYEWKTRGEPFYMRRKDSRPIMLAGIRRNGAFAVLTTSANDLMQPVHHRMPVIVASENRVRWLDSSVTSRAGLEDLLSPPGGQDYEIFQVSERVNSVANDSPACLRRGPDQQSLF